MELNQASYAQRSNCFRLFKMIGPALDETELKSKVKNILVMSNPALKGISVVEATRLGTKELIGSQNKARPVLVKVTSINQRNEYRRVVFDCRE